MIWKNKHQRRLYTRIQDRNYDASVCHLISAMYTLDTVYSLAERDRMPLYGDGTENKRGELSPQRDTHLHWAAGTEHNSPGCLSHSGAPASWL